MIAKLIAFKAPFQGSNCISKFLSFARQIRLYFLGFHKLYPVRNMCTRLHNPENCSLVGKDNNVTPQKKTINLYICVI